MNDVDSKLMSDNLLAFARAFVATMLSPEYAVGARLREIGEIKDGQLDEMSTSSKWEDLRSFADTLTDAALHGTAAAALSSADLKKILNEPVLVTLIEHVRGKGFFLGSSDLPDEPPQRTIHQLNDMRALICRNCETKNLAVILTLSGSSEQISTIQGATVVCPLCNSDMQDTTDPPNVPALA